MRHGLLKWHLLLIGYMTAACACCQNVTLENTNRSLSTNGSVTISSTKTAIIKNCTITAKQDVTLTGNVKMVNARIECNVLHFNATSLTTRGVVTIVCNQLDSGTGVHQLENSKLARSKLTVTATDVNGTGTFGKHRRLAFIITGK